MDHDIPTPSVVTRVDEAVKTARAVATGQQSELHVGYIASVAAHLLPHPRRGVPPNRLARRIWIDHLFL